MKQASVHDKSQELATNYPIKNIIHLLTAKTSINGSIEIDSVIIEKFVFA